MPLPESDGSPEKLSTARFLSFRTVLDVWHGDCKVLFEFWRANSTPLIDEERRK